SSTLSTVVLNCATSICQRHRTAYGKCSTEYTKGTPWYFRASGPSADHQRTSIARGQVTCISEIARLTTVLHYPFIEPNNVKWRCAGQHARAVLNRPAQADIVRASTLCRVMR